MYLGRATLILARGWDGYNLSNQGVNDGRQVEKLRAMLPNGDGGNPSFQRTQRPFVPWVLASH